MEDLAVRQNNGSPRAPTLFERLLYDQAVFACMHRLSSATMAMALGCMPVTFIYTLREKLRLWALNSTNSDFTGLSSADAKPCSRGMEWPIRLDDMDRYHTPTSLFGVACKSTLARPRSDIELYCLSFNPASWR